MEIDLSSIGIKDSQAAIDQAIEITTTYGMDMLGAIIILILGWMAAGWAKSIVTRGLGKIKNADATLTGFISNLVRYAVLAVTIMAVLDRFGVETTSLIAVFGAAGLAIGLALQGTLSNVAAGVMLLIFRPFRVGHYVEAGGKAGTVKSLGLFTTEMATIDNVQIIVPNSDIWGSVITNYSFHKTRRHDITVGIAYEADIDAAINVFKKIVNKDKRVLNDPKPEFMVMSLGDSSVNVNARFWSSSDDFWQVKWDMTKAFKQGLDAVDISIPYPQRTVHLVEAAPSQKKTTAKKKKS